MGKKLFVLAVIMAATVSFADGLCIQLCVDCSQNPENATCAKVDQVCGNCSVILDSLEQDSLAAIARADSIQREKELKDSLQNLEVRKLAEIMQKNCKSDTCVFEVSVAHDQLEHIRAKKGNKVVGNNVVDSASQMSLLPPMSEECRGFCESCATPVDSLSSTENSICEKVESQCKCLAYAEQERMLAEKAVADSIDAIKDFLNKMQNAQTSAKSMFVFCKEKLQVESCSVMVKLNGDKLSIVEFKDLAEKTSPEPAPDTIVQTVAIVKSDKDSTVKRDSSTKVQYHANPYMGISIAFESYLEKEFANYAIYPDKQWGVNLGFFWRWYFYKWGSFQTGANVVYHHAEYDFDGYDMEHYMIGYGEGGIDYQNLMLEIPLQFRFGFPLNKAGAISPFISASFHVRKPIYIWTDYDTGWTWSDDLYWGYDYDIDESYDGFYALPDWEFLTYVGVGIEFSRFFSLQWQFLPVSIVTNTDTINNYYCDDSDGLTWRISMDIAW